MTNGTTKNSSSHRYGSATTRPRPDMPRFKNGCRRLIESGVSSNRATSNHRVTTTGLDASHDRYTCCSQVIASAWREVFGWVTRTTLPEGSLTR